VAKNKETLLYYRLKKLNKNYYFLRIETNTIRGIPDLFCLIKGNYFWLELKASKVNKLGLSKYQKSFHIKFNSIGGKAFILLKDVSQSRLKLFKIDPLGVRELLNLQDTRQNLDIIILRCANLKQ